jgi:hypothetical protein
MLISNKKENLHHSSKKCGSHKTVEIKYFLHIFAGCWKDPDKKNYRSGCGSRRPKIIGSGTLL